MSSSSTPHNLRNDGDVALGQQIEIFHQRLHRGVVAVELAELDCEALAQIPGTDAGRIEFLQHRQHRFDIPLRGAQPLGGLPEIRRQVAGIVDQIDQILPDHALRRPAERHRELFGEMAAERHLGGDEGFQIVVVVVGGAAAPFGVGGRCRILRHAGGGFGGFLGKNVVERGVQRLLDLGTGAEVAVQPLLLAGLEGVAGRACGHIGGFPAAVLAIAAGIGVLGAFGGRLARDRGFGTVAGAIQQRIALQFLLDESREVEIRQLQQLDRLHQLRRHHQRLRLAEL